jgi:hypothetical protein
MIKRTGQNSEFDVRQDVQNRPRASEICGNDLSVERTQAQVDVRIWEEPSRQNFVLLRTGEGLFSFVQNTESSDKSSLCSAIILENHVKANNVSGWTMNIKACGWQF